MPVVSALYRYPVKGFTPEHRDELVVQPDGRIAGDRVLAFRFADATSPEDADGLESWPKSRGLALMDFPALARVQLGYDEDARTVRVSVDGRVLAEAGLDEAGRRELEEAVTAYVQRSPDVRRLERGGVLPLRLVGDGVTSRFQDRARGYVSLHGAASVEEVDAAVSALIDSRRFRSNIVLEGVPAWDELGWTGRVRVGSVLFDVQRPIGRCAAIMANPDTGERDARLLRVLTSEFDQAEPTLGILLLPSEGGGAVRVGDEVTVEAG
ncbi:MOSC domain-containing protein [Microbacterium oleivorans]|uniref:MOSC domain-containing protein n=1 Tax=Microbacterium oleivorans TaxID=273677 RepID=A0A7D5F6U6_9MICO|nr:MOSC domain-containing protein [Microbacterium oleivorans]QLD11633.1 MOSC domain-containing protein [Microbacterium oleivorans]